MIPQWHRDLYQSITAITGIEDPSDPDTEGTVIPLSRLAVEMLLYKIQTLETQAAGKASIVSEGVEENGDEMYQRAKKALEGIRTIRNVQAEYDRETIELTGERVTPFAAGTFTEVTLRITGSVH